jgi:ATP-binding cassette, subfamily B, heavy metal transporter
MNFPSDLGGRLHMVATTDAPALRALRTSLWLAGGWNLRLRLAAVLAMAFVSAALAAIAPLFLRRLIDALSVSARGGVPIALAFAYPAVRFLGLGTIQVRVILTAAIMEGVKARFAVTAFGHILGLPRAFHLDRNTGALARALERGVAGLETSVRSTHVVLFQVLLEATLVCVVLSQVISWTFALILLAVMMGYAAIAIVCTRWQTRARRLRNQYDSTANGRAVESLLNIDVVRAFGRTPYEIDRYAAAKTAQSRVAVRVAAAVSSMNIGWQALEAVAVGAMLSLAAIEVGSGAMKISQLVLAQIYMMQVFANMTGLGLVYNDARQGFVDLAELQNVLDRPAEPHDAPGAPALTAPHGRVVFDRVSFGYRRDRRVLDDVSLEIPPGRTLALVGASGAGKTTIGALLLRFHDIASGRILIDGQDIAAVSRASLREAIGVVPQDTHLFNDTLAFNIRYGRLTASDEEVRQAARHAALDTFIESLPDGYDTVVGERGLKLSGGERQRIALARLFLRRPRILLFDEATSSVDSLTEAVIQRSIRELSQGRTTLIIAHRLSTIADADEIAVIDHGRVAERGAHHTLLARGGVYARLWERQAEAGREMRAVIPDQFSR